MTVISAQSVLEYIQATQTQKEHERKFPFETNDFDLIRRFKLIPKVALASLIEQKKITPVEALNCRFYRIN